MDSLCPTCQLKLRRERRPCFYAPEDYQPKKARNEQLCTMFNVSCVKCDSVNLKFITEFDDELGEAAVYLFCPRCRQRERLKL